MGIYGVDIHPRFQAGINIEEIRREGFDFLAVKVSEQLDGSYLAAGSADFLRRGRAAGLLRLGYHYMRAGNEAAQAAVFTKALASTGVPGMLDAEALAADGRTREGEQCRVVPAPAFQRPILAVASYLRPPALTRSRVGHFFVPFSPDGATEEQITQRLRSNARAAAHDLCARGLPRAPLAAVLGCRSVPGGAGGAPQQLFCGRVGALRRGHDARAGILQRSGARTSTPRRPDLSGSPDHGGYRTALRGHGAGTSRGVHGARASLSSGTAKAEVDRYCAWPTQAPSYLTGCLEIEQLRTQWTGQLREFHDTLAGSGCLPLGLARRALAVGGQVHKHP